MSLEAEGENWTTTKETETNIFFFFFYYFGANVHRTLPFPIFLLLTSFAWWRTSNE